MLFKRAAHSAPLAHLQRRPLRHYSCLFTSRSSSSKPFRLLHHHLDAVMAPETGARPYCCWPSHGRLILHSVISVSAFKRSMNGKGRPQHFSEPIGPSFSPFYPKYPQDIWYEVWASTVLRECTTNVHLRHDGQRHWRTTSTVVNIIAMSPSFSSAIVLTVPSFHKVDMSCVRTVCRAAGLLRISVATWPAKRICAALPSSPRQASFTSLLKAVQGWQPLLAQ